MVPDFLMFFMVFSGSVLAESKPGPLVDSRGQKLWFWYNRCSGFRFLRRLRPFTFFYHVIRVTSGHFLVNQRPYLDSTQNLGGNPFFWFLTFLWKNLKVIHYAYCLIPSIPPRELVTNPTICWGFPSICQNLKQQITRTW